MRIPRTVTLGQIATALSVVGALCGIMGWFFALYFGGLQNTKDITTVTTSQAIRSKEVDEKFSKINEKVDDLKIGLTEVKSDVNYTRDAQAGISEQVSQVQMDIRNLTSILLKEKMAAYDKYTALNKVTYNPNNKGY